MELLLTVIGVAAVLVAGRRYRAFVVSTSERERRLEERIATIEANVFALQTHLNEAEVWVEHLDTWRVGVEHPDMRPLAFMFAVVLRDVPRYLKLLNPREDDENTLRVLEKLATAMAHNGPVDNAIRAMLNDDAWSSHLVAAWAILLHDERTPFLDALWLRIDEGSWVVPQLVATASICDPDFDARALRWLNEPPKPKKYAKPRNLGEAASMHSRLGPSLGTGKAANALLRLLRDREEARAIAERPAMRALLDTDVDSGGDIAEGWRRMAIPLLSRSTRR